MNQDHLNKFIEFKDEAFNEEQWVGSNIYLWWKWVSDNLPKKSFAQGYILPKSLPVDSEKGRLNRQDLKDLCHKDSEFSDLDCVISIMAWGGQNRKHALSLFKRFDEIEPIVYGMRQHKLNHFEAYDAFYKVWLKPEKLGIGAAYFTKLVFFCEPHHRGYIMDQWTSKSINLLMDRDIVNLAYGYVSKRNTVERYREFCTLTDKIAQELNKRGQRIRGAEIKGEDVEIAMFSKGGHKKWKWREYVIDPQKNNKEKY